MGLLFTSFGKESKQKLFNTNKSYGGFGGFTMNIHNNDAFEISGEGAALIHNFYIGGFGYQAKLGTYQSKTQEKEYEVTSSVGGFMMGYFSNPEAVVGMFIETKFGFGSTTARSGITTNIFEEIEQSVFVFNPNLGVTIQPLPFILIKVYIGYQHSDTKFYENLDGDPLKGMSFGIGFSFGKIQDL